MPKVVISSLGAPEDASFQGSDGKTIECNQVWCKGTVDGRPSEFFVKVYGKNGVSRLKQGLEFNGKYNSFQNQDYYSLTKADNPSLFPNSGSYGGGGYNGKRSYQSNPMVSALKIATDIVCAFQGSAGEQSKLTLDGMEDEAIRIAKTKIVPALKTSDNKVASANNEDRSKELVKSIITNNDLGGILRDAGKKMSDALDIFKECNGDENAFVTKIRDMKDVDEDDIPF
jgi:hypothetical protein